MDRAHKLRQQDIILRHLRDFGSVTGYQLVMEYNIMSYTRRITDLRQRGYPIKSVTEYRRNVYGDMVPYTRYVLDKADGERQLRMKI